MLKIICGFILSSKPEGIDWRLYFFFWNQIQFRADDGEEVGYVGVGLEKELELVIPQVASKAAEKVGALGEFIESARDAHEKTADSLLQGWEGASGINPFSATLSAKIKIIVFRCFAVLWTNA